VGPLADLALIDPARWLRAKPREIWTTFRIGHLTNHNSSRSWGGFWPAAASPGRRLVTCNGMAYGLAQRRRLVGCGHSPIAR